MTVKISKPAINVREELADLKKPTGIAGEAMLKAETVAEQQALIGVGRRNMIINGDMKVAQRGTSFDSQGTSSGVGYTVDRFAWVRREETGSGFTFDATITQDADSPSGFDKSLKVVSDTAQSTLSGSENALITTKFEGQDLQRFGWGTTGAKDVTLSFWVKSNKAGTYCVQFRYINHANSGLFEYNVSSSGVWEYKTISIPANPSFSFTSNNANEMELMFHLAVGPSDISAASPSIGTTNFRATSNQVNLMDTASNYWQITGVQLELGKVATPFEHRSYGEELALCHRYFRVIGPYGNPRATGGNDFFLVNVMYNNENRLCAPYFDTAFRATPSVTLINHSNGGTGALTEFSSGTVRSQTSFSQIGLHGGGYPQFNGNFGNPAFWRAEYNAEL